MNIKITHNWLLEYLDTDASPYEIQKYLSLCGPSVDRVEKIGNDYVYDIEITSNRVDSASVLGIAQECLAILPMFGKKANFKVNPLDEYKFNNYNFSTDRDQSSNFKLKIKIADLNLCSRFTTIVLDNIKIQPPPNFIKERLTACGIKSINNVVDISNYLMIALGQPTHVFDYNKVGKEIMIMRQSKKGEKIVTLDEKKIILPGGDIIIEDGDGKLIDLCGIMGGFNSSVSKNTKKIVLFVQTYNKQKIRQTSMSTGQRTVAATYFEKGLDEERVEPTLVYGVELLEKYAGGKIASKIYDIYPHPYKEKTLDIRYSIFEKIIGIKIPEEKIIFILKNLSFGVKSVGNAYMRSLQITIPSWRASDINIKEDIVEEVARIYGYCNLPNNLQPPVYVKQPKEIEKLFIFQPKIKYFLKHLGLHEVMNYSMISKKMIKNLGMAESEHLHLSNTISEEIEYMRVSLLPSLIKNIRDNFGKKEILKLFEIAKIYHPIDVGNAYMRSLPNEIYKLGIVVNTDFFDLKGIIEALLSELNIESYQLIVNRHPSLNIFHSRIQTALIIREKIVGYLGQLKPELKLKNNLKTDVFLAEIDFQMLIDNHKIVPTYKPINPYAVVKLDLTINLSEKNNFATIQNLALKTSKLLQKIELIGIFRNKITCRFYFSSPKRNITEEEAKSELSKIKHLL